MGRGEREKEGGERRKHEIYSEEGREGAENGGKMEVLRGRERRLG